MDAAPEDHLSRLNEAQRRAVEHRGGPLIVLAGPGTGKTRVIVERIAHLLRGGAEPEKILAITFTNKAANEMRSRLNAMVGRALADRLTMGTFHSIARRSMLRFGDLIGLRHNPVLMDSAQRKRLIRELIDADGLFPWLAAQGREQAVESAGRFIERCRQSAITPEDAVLLADDWAARTDSDLCDRSEIDRLAEQAKQREYAERARLYARFHESCILRGYVDFDDYIVHLIRIMSQNPETAAIIRSETRHVVVDEFQDVNELQIEMLRQYAPPDGKPDVCVVGDDDQAIYAFRGATQHAFARFSEIWTDPTIERLEVNYRSAPQLIRAAADFIVRTPDRFEPDKTLVPAPNAHGENAGTIEAVLCDDEYQYGTTIAAMIRTLRSRREIQLGRIAVLARGWTDLDRIALQFELESIPYTMRNRGVPAADEAVQNAMALMRLIVEPADDFATIRLLSHAPFLIPIDDLAALRSEHNRTMSAALRTGRELHTLPSFSAWVIETMSDRPEVRGFAEVVSGLRTLAASNGVDRIAHEVVRQLRLAALHPSGPGEHAVRVGNLASFLRFVERVAERLPYPADVRAFLRYYDDLDQDEQSMRDDQLGGDDPLDRDSHDASDPDSVHLLTAHSAKGLEFDTVFVVRVRSPHGFPSVKSESEELLPPEAEAGMRTIKMDEERRLFYVAMTRAERHLILLAKRKKTKSSDFFQELTEENPELGVVLREQRDVLDEEGSSAEAGYIRALDLRRASQSDRSMLLDREERRAQDRLFAAAWAASRGPRSPDEFDRIRRLADEVAARLSVIGHLRNAEQGSAPPFISRLTSDQRSEAERLMHEAAKLSHARGFAPLKPPLRLSYTSIRDYKSCPACFYVRHVLRLPEPMDESRTMLTIGNIVHRALERFYREFREATAEGQPLPGRDRLLSLGREAYDQMWPHTLERPEAGWEQIEGQLTIAHDRFHSPDVNVLEIERDFGEMPYEIEGVVHSLVAKIDRIDQIEGGVGLRYRLIDYKTGTPRKDLLEPKPSDLQLGIYSLALQHHFGSDEPLPGVAEYWLLSTGQQGVLDLSEINYKNIHKTISEAARGMLAGEFDKGGSCRGLCSILGY